jgi:hypothetical protein
VEPVQGGGLAIPFELKLVLRVVGGDAYGADCARHDDRRAAPGASGIAPQDVLVVQRLSCQARTCSSLDIDLGLRTHPDHWACALGSVVAEPDTRGRDVRHVYPGDPVEGGISISPPPFSGLPVLERDETPSAR